MSRLFVHFLDPQMHLASGQAQTGPAGIATSSIEISTYAFCNSFSLLLSLYLDKKLLMGIESVWNWRRTSNRSSLKGQPLPHALNAAEASAKRQRAKLRWRVNRGTDRSHQDRDESGRRTRTRGRRAQFQTHEELPQSLSPCRHLPQGEAPTATTMSVSAETAKRKRIQVSAACNVTPVGPLRLPCAL